MPFLYTITSIFEIFHGLLIKFIVLFGKYSFRVFSYTLIGTSITAVTVCFYCAENFFSGFTTLDIIAILYHKQSYAEIWLNAKHSKDRIINFYITNIPPMKDATAKIQNPPY